MDRPVSPALGTMLYYLRLRVTSWSIDKKPQIIHWSATFYCFSSASNSSPIYMLLNGMDIYISPRPLCMCIRKNIIRSFLIFLEMDRNWLTEEANVELNRFLYILHCKPDLQAQCINNILYHENVIPKLPLLLYSSLQEIFKRLGDEVGCNHFLIIYLMQWKWPWIFSFKSFYCKVVNKL